jgi:hypothetical protein
MQIPPRLRGLLAAALFVTLLPLLGLSEIAVKNRYLAGRVILPPESYTLPPAPVMRALSLGYNELGSDLLWIKTIVYFADHMLGDRDLRYLSRHLKNVLVLDSHARHVYRFGASMLVIQGERTTNRDVRAAIDLLERGHKLYPEDWRFPLYIGVNYLGRMKSRSKVKRRRWKLLGADWIRRAVLTGAPMPWLPALAAKVYSQEGERDLAILHLQEIYHAAQTDKMKAQITAKLRSLQAAKVADDVKRTIVTLREARAKGPIPYVPPDLFLLVGLPELGPFSLEEVVGERSESLLR